MVTPSQMKGVARNLAALADFGILLHFNKRPDLCLVSDFAAVQIDELRQLHIAAQLYIGRYTEVRILGVTAALVLVFFMEVAELSVERPCHSDGTDEVT